MKYSQESHSVNMKGIVGENGVYFGFILFRQRLWFQYKAGGCWTRLGVYWKYLYTNIGKPNQELILTNCQTKYIYTENLFNAHHRKEWQILKAYNNIFFSTFCLSFSWSAKVIQLKRRERNWEGCPKNIMNPLTEHVVVLMYDGYLFMAFILILK